MIAANSVTISLELIPFSAFISFAEKDHVSRWINGEVSVIEPAPA